MSQIPVKEAKVTFEPLLDGYVVKVGVMFLGFSALGEKEALVAAYKFAAQAQQRVYEALIERLEE